MTDAQAKTISLALWRTQHGLFRDCSICGDPPKIKVSVHPKPKDGWTRSNIFSAECCGYTNCWWTSMESCAESWNGMVQQIDDDINTSLDELEFNEAPEIDP